MIYETHLKYKLSKLILFFELLILFVLLTLYFLGGFTESELSTILGIFLPMFFLYLTAIIKFAFENRYLSDGKPIAPLFASASFYLLLAMFLTLIISLFLKALYNIIEFHVLKTLLIVIHSGFAIYCGYFVTELFSNRAEE